MTAPSSDSNAGPVGRRVRTVEAAAVAGIVYAVLSFINRILLESAPDLDDPGLVDWYADEGNQQLLVTALGLTSIATVSFLWLIAVIRRRIGEREDQFFSTVFLGSGIVLIVSRLLATAAAVSPAVSAQLLDAEVLDETIISVAAGLGDAVGLLVAPRIEAVFVITTSTVVLRSQALPTWLAYVGYVLGLIKFVVPFVIEPMDLLFPLWVLLVSMTLLVTRPGELVASSDGGDLASTTG